MNWGSEIDVARAAAVRAGEHALDLRAKGISTDWKCDGSPVTNADRECERLIAQALEQAFPDDGLLGEEGVQRPPRSGRRWIIDPIDGTRDYVRGAPAWAVLIGLEDAGEIGELSRPGDGRERHRRGVDRAGGQAVGSGPAQDPHRGSRRAFLQSRWWQHDLRRQLRGLCAGVEAEIRAFLGMAQPQLSV